MYLPDQDIAESTPRCIVKRKLGMFASLFGALLLLSSSATAQVNTASPFTGQHQEGFEASMTLTGGYTANPVFQGQADYFAVNPIRSSGWTFDCAIYPHSGSRFVGDAGGGPVWFDFGSAPTKFGGYFGSNQPDGAVAGIVTVTVSFFDSAMSLIHSEDRVIQNDCQWHWLGWEITAPDVFRIEFDAAPAPGFLMIDDLELDSGQSCGVGTPFCLGDDPTICPCANASTNGGGCMNGTGYGSVLCASGSSSVGNNNLVLHADHVPLNQFGLFFYGANQINLPFGDGLRCVGAGGSGIHRLGPPIQPDAFGNMTRHWDLTQPPSNAGLGAVSAGETWNVQLWYRDPSTSPCGGVFNLSNGLEINWTQ